MRSSINYTLWLFLLPSKATLNVIAVSGWSSTIRILLNNRGFGMLIAYLILFWFCNEELSRVTDWWWLGLLLLEILTLLLLLFSLIMRSHLLTIMMAYKHSLDTITYAIVTHKSMYLIFCSIVIKVSINGKMNGIKD